MRSHLVLMLIFSLCVSEVLACLQREDPREQVAIGSRMFGGMFVAALVLGWVMRPVPC
jgi:hypothetical protein